MATQGTGQADPYPVATPAEPEWLTRKPADARSGESRVRGYESKLIGFAAVVIFLAVWQGIGVIRAVWPEGVVIGPFTYVAPTQLFLPTPVEIGQAFGTYARDPKFGRDILMSGQELSFGYLLAAFTAIPLGLVMGWYSRIRYAFDPFVTFLYATPRIVLLPLLIIWLGIGVESKVAVVFLGAFFAMVINTTAGVRNLDANLIKVARAFGSSEPQDKGEEPHAGEDRSLRAQREGRRARETLLQRTVRLEIQGLGDPGGRQLLPHRWHRARRRDQRDVARETRSGRVLRHGQY